MNDWKDLAQLILTEMKRFDQNHRDVIKDLGIIKEDQAKINTTLKYQKEILERLSKDIDKNTQDLEHHIKRTDILEILYKDSFQEVEKVEARLDIIEEPIKAAAYITKKWKLYTGVLIVIISIVGAILKWVSFT